jgi:hypothetical protein
MTTRFGILPSSGRNKHIGLLIFLWLIFRNDGRENSKHTLSLSDKLPESFNIPNYALLRLGQKLFHVNLPDRDMISPTSLFDLTSPYLKT